MNLSTFFVPNSNIQSGFSYLSRILSNTQSNHMLRIYLYMCLMGVTSLKMWFSAVLGLMNIPCKPAYWDSTLIRKRAGSCLNILKCVTACKHCQNRFTVLCALLQNLKNVHFNSIQFNSIIFPQLNFDIFSIKNYILAIQPKTASH